MPQACYFLCVLLSWWRKKERSHNVRLFCCGACCRRCSSQNWASLDFETSRLRNPCALKFLECGLALNSKSALCKQNLDLSHEQLPMMSILTTDLALPWWQRSQTQGFLDSKLTKYVSSLRGLKITTLAIDDYEIMLGRHQTASCQMYYSFCFIRC